MEELILFPKDIGEITPTGLKLREGMPFETWKDIGSRLRQVNQSVQFWIGDWIIYGEAEYGEMYAQALDATDYSYQSLRHFSHVASAIDCSDRRNNLSFSIHSEVANLPRDQQVEILEKAEKGMLQCREVRQLVRKLKWSTKEAPPLPEGKYSVIYADPPWDVGAGPGWDIGEESRLLEYQSMPISEIKALRVEDIAAEDAHLYLWTINKYIPEAYAIAEEWGFSPSCLLTWVKPPHGIGLGGTYIQTSEHLLFCRRGSLEASQRIDTTWFAYPRGRHSEKPREIRKMIEEVSPGNRIELFARVATPGWVQWGNEA